MWITSSNAFVFFVLFPLVPNCCVTSLSNDVDKFNNCQELAAAGACETNAELMIQNCPKTCGAERRRQQQQRRDAHKVEVRRVEKEGSFFELQAKNFTGSSIYFDQFEGYITIVAFFAKTCGGDLTKDMTEQVIASLEHLHSIWPFTLEILLFPFEHPNHHQNQLKEASSTSSSGQGKEDLMCQRYKDVCKIPRRTIRVMEEVSIHGKDIHSVYKFFKDLFGMDKMETDVVTFFLVAPNGDLVERHVGTNSNQMKTYIQQHLEYDL